MGRERELGPGAYMRDDLGGRQGAQPGALDERQVPGEAMEEARGEKVAGAGRIHDPLHRMRLDDMNLVTLHDDAASLRARQRRDGAILAHPLHSLVEMRDLIERGDLPLIGEDDVDVVADELEERVAMAVDAEAIGERDGNQAT